MCAVYQGVVIRLTSNSQYGESERMGNVLYKVSETFGRRNRHMDQIHREKKTLNTADSGVSPSLKIITDTPVTGTPADTHRHWISRKFERRRKLIIKLQVDPTKRCYFSE